MSLTLVAISLTAMAGVGAIAVDLGMLYKARADALRAAEAAALAGASVFLDFAPDTATARARALQLALANTILNSPVQAGEVEVAPDLGAERVAVRVGRSGIGTWFARVLGDDSVRVGAVATAGVTEASGANCVTPIMLPDAWGNDIEDTGTPWEDQIEPWQYGDAPGDSYGPFDRPGPQTGYGSDHRNLFPGGYTNDYGRPITLKDQSATSGPGGYRLWVYEGEPPEIAERLSECDARPVSLGSGGFEVAPAGETLPLGELSARIAADAGTSWDAGQNQMQSSSQADWRHSPRVIKVALFDPGQIPTMGSGLPVQFNNIVLFFLETVDPVEGSVTGRLLYYSVGNNDDEGDAGALVKRVKLVE
jgi:hypothetical protein